jgi:hypothetical protein
MGMRRQPLTTTLSIAAALALLLLSSVPANASDAPILYDAPCPPCCGIDSYSDPTPARTSHTFNITFFDAEDLSTIQEKLRSDTRSLRLRDSSLHKVRVSVFESRHERLMDIEVVQPDRVNSADMHLLFEHLRSEALHARASELLIMQCHREVGPCVECWHDMATPIIAGDCTP